MMGSSGIAGINAVMDIGAAQTEGFYKGLVHRQNAGTARAQAEDAMARGHSDSIRIASRAKSMLGSQRAALAAQGIDLGTGSALDIQSNTVQLAEMDAITIRVNAAREAQGFDTQARDIERQARMDEYAMQNRITSNLLTFGFAAYGASQG